MAISANKIGIMQGRLSEPQAGRIQAFPVGAWRDEFPKARAAKLGFIEWIYDAYGADDNPVLSRGGIDEIMRLSQESGVGVHSLCADWFMDFPLLRCEESELKRRVEHLLELIGLCGYAGLRYIILPFVDASRFESDAEVDEFAALLTGTILPAARAQGLEIHLETSLPPDKIVGLLERVPDPLFRMNYDSGNSSSLGYHPDAEFAAYGRRIGSIHIKDRVIGGATVPLGSGAAEFESLFRNIRAVDYAGPFVLQVARGETGDEVGLAERNREWLEARLEGVRREPDGF